MRERFRRWLFDEIGADPPRRPAAWWRVSPARLVAVLMGAVALGSWMQIALFRLYEVLPFEIAMVFLVLSAHVFLAQTLFVMVLVFAALLGPLAVGALWCGGVPW